MYRGLKTRHAEIRAKKTGKKSQMSQIWLVSSETWYKYCPCLLVVYGGSEISCPLLRRCLVWREWADARFQKVNRCEIFCYVKLAFQFRFFPTAAPWACAHLRTHLTHTHQLHLHTCIQTVWTDCPFPLGSSLPLWVWTLFPFTPGHNKNSLHLWLKPHNLNINMSLYENSLKQPLWLEWT